MNKDVIYVEPENDITDIITKIEQSPEKIVVLVPPKKAGVFRSVVNIKLMARAANSAEKTVVLVTVDPSIVKLAATARIPVTKDLKTPPEVPAMPEEEEDVEEEEIIEEIEPDGTEEVTVVEKSVEKPVENSDEDAEETEEKEDEKDSDEETEEEDKKAQKKAKKAAKKAKKPRESGFKGWVKAHKISLIVGSIGLIALIGFLVWALVFAPAVSVAVEIQTEDRSIAENVTFTTDPKAEDAKNGVFYLDARKLEQTQEINFDATGKKNVGEKASGEASVYTYFKSKNNVIPINEGATFSVQGKNFVVTKGANLSWDGKSSSCENASEDDDISGVMDYGCLISRKITVQATEGGSGSNLSWNGASILSAGVYSDGSTSGGTDKEIKIVEQIDVERAKDQLMGQNEEADREDLLKQIGDKMMPLTSTFSESTATAVATPGVGEEVGEGVTPVLKATTTATMYAIDRSKLEEFITEKADLAKDQEVYEVNDPFIENFMQSGAIYTGRLKTNYKVGPKVTNDEVIELVKGKGLGDAQHAIKRITGVVNVTIDKSVPWVLVVPDDSNKISVDITVQGGDKDQSDQASETDQQEEESE